MSNYTIIIHFNYKSFGGKIEDLGGGNIPLPPHPPVDETLPIALLQSTQST